MKFKIRVLAAALLSVHLGFSLAAGPQDAERLGKDLTPLGGEKAGNKEGTIPAWSGVEQPIAGWSHGKKRVDFWKHKDEKPLFSIDASNVDKYADKLTPGQVQLIKEVKGYRMDVFPSHRTCDAPAFVNENTKKNVTTGGCAEFCVNGLLAGDCRLVRSHNEQEETRRTRRVAGRVAGQLQET